MNQSNPSSVVAPPNAQPKKESSLGPKALMFGLLLVALVVVLVLGNSGNNYPDNNATPTSHGMRIEAQVPGAVIINNGATPPSTAPAQPELGVTPSDQGQIRTPHITANKDSVEEETSNIPGWMWVALMAAVFLLVIKKKDNGTREDPEKKKPGDKSKDPPKDAPKKEEGGSSLGWLATIVLFAGLVVASYTALTPERQNWVWRQDLNELLLVLIGIPCAIWLNSSSNYRKKDGKVVEGKPHIVPFPRLITLALIVLLIGIVYKHAPEPFQATASGVSRWWNEKDAHKPSPTLVRENQSDYTTRLLTVRANGSGEPFICPANTTWWIDEYPGRIEMDSGSHKGPWTIGPTERFPRLTSTNRLEDRTYYFQSLEGKDLQVTIKMKLAR